MFDWNDEELTNIIWGEAGESDDHIVPYPDQIEEKQPALFGELSKKETNQQLSNNSPTELKKPLVKSEPGVEVNEKSKYDISKPATGFGVDSWPDGPAPSSSNATKGDLESTGMTVSSNIIKSSKYGSSRDETAQLNKDSGIFDNAPEDGEHDDFVDYGWANIGSFDDLDRIFSNNDDPIFGDISVGNTDELWSSSKDIPGSPRVPTPLSGDSADSPLGALKNSVNQPVSNTQYTQDPSQSFASGYDKLNEITYHAPQDVQTFVAGGKVPEAQEQLYDGTSASCNEFPDKLFSCVQGHRRKRLPNSKGQKLDKKSDTKQVHNLTGSWTSSGFPPQQVNSAHAPLMVNPSSPFVLSQQRPLQRLDSFQPKLFSGAPMVSPLYGNIANPYPASPVLAQIRPGERNCDLVPPPPFSYEVPPPNVNPLKNLDDTPVKPPSMTPKEKIEKLRRQQQMRAMLAIQKQQLQFGNQASVSDHSSLEGGKIEVDDSLNSFPSLEMSSPGEHDDSNTIGMALDNCSVEESVLFRLQDTIAKLDIPMRLCIRDSLYRLAQSAMQRQHPHDTSSANTNSRDEAPSNKDIGNNGRMPDVETDTNPIDRTVAHLLFHRPLDNSGKSADMPASPSSANVPYERKTNLLKSLAKGYFPETLNNTPTTSPQGSKSTGIFSEGHQSKHVTCFAPSENTSQTENPETMAAPSK
ncbi:protein LNK2 isoform X2 [Andrographis paniculata]|uniref:protein LNK2 isoform X2 n=1 Tax=Andrographis paniculata TaxID=175694 RepID=UPI0021E753FA|nr:protein LNK2 isoform X2 [Andrographis paniculata]